MAITMLDVEGVTSEKVVVATYNTVSEKQKFLPPHSLHLIWCILCKFNLHFCFHKKSCNVASSNMAVQSVIVEISTTVSPLRDLESL